VTVRELIPVARPESESPMESEARLAVLDGGLPEPTLHSKGRLDCQPRRASATRCDGAPYRDAQLSRALAA
jgi:hypothetical protein